MNANNILARGGLNPIRALQSLQQKITQVKEALSKAEFSGRSGGGAVELTVTGNGDLRELKISEELLTEGSDAVVAYVKSAFQEAHSRKEQAAREAFKESGLNPMGLFA